MAERTARRQTLPTQIPPERPGRAGGKRDLNRRERTDALLSAAEQLFLERGIGEASIEDITRAAGIAKGSFYRYFPDKRGLVEALLAPTRSNVINAFQRAEAQLLDEGDTDVGRVYLRLGRELMITLMGSPNVTRLYLQESRAPAMEARAPVRALEREMFESAHRVTQVAFERGLLHRASPEVSTLAVIGAVERLLSAHFSGALESEPGAAMQGLVSLVLNGMR